MRHRSLYSRRGGIVFEYEYVCVYRRMVAAVQWGERKQMSTGAESVCDRRAWEIYAQDVRRDAPLLLGEDRLNKLSRT